MRISIKVMATLAALFLTILLMAGQCGAVPESHIGKPITFSNPYLTESFLI